MFASYTETSRFQRVLLLWVCSSFWHAPHLAAASDSSLEDLSCQSSEHGECSRGNSLLQLASKPSRTVQSPPIEDDAATASEVKQGVAMLDAASATLASFVQEGAVINATSANPLLAATVRAAMLQATNTLLRTLGRVQTTHGGLAISLVVGLALVGLCTVFIIMRVKSDSSFRREQFGHGHGRLPTFSQMPPQTAGRLLQRHTQAAPVSQQNLAYRGEQRPQLSPGMPATSSSRTLCPGLVVPDASDCVLVIRMLPMRHSNVDDFGDAAAGRGAIENQIFDLAGRPVLGASIVQPWPGDGKEVVRLRTLHTPANREPPPLSRCRAGHSGKSVYIHDKDDALFGSVAMDGQRYVLSQNNEAILLFDGDFREHRVRIFDVRQNNAMIAHAEPCRTDFEPDGCFYQARVAAGVDVGIILAGLLSIDAMEENSRPFHPTLRG